jgi:hypothetical protein
MTGPSRWYAAASWALVVVGVWLATRARFALTDGMSRDRLDLAIPFAVAFGIVAFALLWFGLRRFRMAPRAAAVGALLTVGAVLPYDWWTGTRAGFAVNAVLAAMAVTWVACARRGGRRAGGALRP